ncbi:hypothetical protein ACROSR_19290 [Roseovarius tibetensis]|uniref:hypothetical protein n=1 Tax=Roseovarius tibetensis TaxID=2685897 RepID=UPI003D7F93DD
MTDALYQVESAQMHYLLQEESRLRRALARLDAQHAANRALPESDLDGLRQIGGDMIWHGWVGRKRAELQTELARVLGRKGQMISKLRRAFGKAQAVERVMETAHAKRLGDTQAREAEARAHLAVLTRWMSS